MTYDPFQNYFQTGPYYGVTAPMNPQLAALQAATNPVVNPLAAATLGISPNVQNGGLGQIGQPAIPGLASQGGIGPQQQLQQLQLAALLAQQQAWPGISPLQGSLVNPQLAASFYNPMVAGLSTGPQSGHHQHAMYGQMGQIGSPFGQQPGQGLGQGQPFGQGLYAQGSPYGQGLPFANLGSAYGQTGLPLAPQSWIGQGGSVGWGGQPYAQMNPLLAQFVPRPFQGLGISPWGY